ncbi:nuclear transport factor 2 family protein [Sphingobium tyrosinilyticum]|uniref:Nuclear transport factor 2 family protein n=1 Tax=Sphingobium tyrosinilyticum TaxID=2715436 RepID=A0ABV9F3R6_9SPHN
MDNMSDVERLIAIEDIKHLKARRDRALDTKDWATYTAVHAPDHISHSDGETRRQGNVVNTDFVIRALHDKVSVHHSHTPEISFETPTRARGIWAMEDNIYWTEDGENHWLRGFGHYHEIYEKRDGQWLFVFRRLTRLRVETSGKFPGFTSPVPEKA